MKGRIKSGHCPFQNRPLGATPKGTSHGYKRDHRAWKGASTQSPVGTNREPGAPHELRVHTTRKSIGPTPKVRKFRFQNGSLPRIQKWSLDEGAKLAPTLEAVFKSNGNVARSGLPIQTANGSATMHGLSIRMAASP